MFLFLGLYSFDQLDVLVFLLSDRGLIKLISQHASCEEVVVVVVGLRLYFKRITLDSNKTDKLVALRKKKKGRNKIKITKLTMLKI